MKGDIDTSDSTFLQLACEAAKSSNCRRRKTGAVLVSDGFPLILACNGTPENTSPCSEGGCPRCASVKKATDGLPYLNFSSRDECRASCLVRRYTSHQSLKTSKPQNFPIENGPDYG